MVATKRSIPRPRLCGPFLTLVSGIRFIRLRVSSIIAFKDSYETLESGERILESLIVIDGNREFRSQNTCEQILEAIEIYYDLDGDLLDRIEHVRDDDDHPDEVFGGN